MNIKYLKTDKAAMRLDNGETIELLWGDRVRVISQSGANSRVRARGVEGMIRTSALGDESLLEF